MGPCSVYVQPLFSRAETSARCRQVADWSRIIISYRSTTHSRGHHPLVPKTEKKAPLAGSQPRKTRRLRTTFSALNVRR
jgi:hypothetical protein